MSNSQNIGLKRSRRSAISPKVENLSVVWLVNQHILSLGSSMGVRFVVVFYVKCVWLLESQLLHHFITQFREYIGTISTITKMKSIDKKNISICR